MLRPRPQGDLLGHPSHTQVEVDQKRFFQVVKAAFGQRRKTLLNALSAGLRDCGDKERLRAAVAACGLPPDVRGERLGIPEFAALTRALYS